MKRFKMSLNGRRENECFLVPTVALTYSRQPAVWKGNDGWRDTPLIGARFYFLILSVSVCAVWRGKEVPKPKSIFEKMTETGWIAPYITKP
jgi:hypothetical protein